MDASSRVRHVPSLDWVHLNNASRSELFRILMKQVRACGQPTLRGSMTRLVSEEVIPPIKLRAARITQLRYRGVLLSMCGANGRTRARAPGCASATATCRWFDRSSMIGKTMLGSAGAPITIVAFVEVSRRLS